MNLVGKYHINDAIDAVRKAKPDWFVLDNYPVTNEMLQSLSGDAGWGGRQIIKFRRDIKVRVKVQEQKRSGVPPKHTDDELKPHIIACFEKDMSMNRSARVLHISTNRLSRIVQTNMDVAIAYHRYINRKQKRRDRRKRRKLVKRT